MDVREFKILLFKAAEKAGFQDWEMYYLKSKALQVRIFEKEVAHYNNSDKRGVSFRGTYQGKMGYAYTEKISVDAVERLINEAKANAGVVEQTDERLHQSDRQYRHEADGRAIENFPPEKLIALGLAMEEAAFAADPRVVSVDHCAVGKSMGQIYIANSYGLDLWQETAYGLGFVVARVCEKEQMKVGGEMWFDRDFKKLDPEALSRKAVAKAVAALGAGTVESTKCGIILKNEAVIDLLSGFVSLFYGETVQKGFSLMKGRMGDAIASEAVTIKDSPAHPKAIEELVFDSEGVFVQDKTVIDKGVLKSFLYNIKSAAKEGIPSTGNGFKSSLSATVGTSCANFYIEPSGSSYEDLIGQLNQGYLITELSGLHSGINAVSGDFSLIAEGFQVMDGVIGKPVDQITIAGNFYDLLKDITAVGSDLKFDTPGAGGSVGAPSLLIGEISISGK